MICSPELQHMVRIFVSTLNAVSPFPGPRPCPIIIMMNLVIVNPHGHITSITNNKIIIKRTLEYKTHLH